MSVEFFNLMEVELDPLEDAPEGHAFSGTSLTETVGAERTGMGIYAVEPGQATWPYHFELTEEEWIVVLEGEIVVRTPDGEQTMRVGDVICFPAGASGAHAVRNEGAAAARFAMLSSRAVDVDGAIYPDSGTFVVRTDGFRHRGRLGDTVAYWEGEP